MGEDNKNITQFHNIIGSPGTFESGNDITIFESRLTHFFVANGISNKVQKRAILLSSISDTKYYSVYAFKLNQTLRHTAHYSVKQLLHKPVKSYFASRHAFYNAKQRPYKTVAEWGAYVKNMASKCNFSTELQIVIHDIFAVGMNASPIQDRLLEEDASKVNITYSHLMKISAAKESTINTKTGWI